MRTTGRAIRDPLFCMHMHDVHNKNASETLARGISFFSTRRLNAYFILIFNSLKVDTFLYTRETLWAFNSKSYKLVLQ